MTKEKRREAALTEKRFLTIQVKVSVVHKYGTTETDGITKYTANIGYTDKPLPGTSDPIKAYIYGIKYPMKRFTGIIIGYGKRKDGNDFIVVADNKTIAYDVNIIPFVKRYEGDDFTLFSAYEKSCGAMIFRRFNSEIRFLIVKQRLSNSWSFPKGHILFGESEHDTAKREIMEEVGIKVSFIPDFRVEQYYHIKPSTVKKVVIFLAKSNDEIKIDNNEIISYAWTDEHSIGQYLHKKDALALLKKAKNHIIKNKLY